MLTHIDLFSGIGGFALAAQWAGFKTVVFCENEPFCQEVLAARFGVVADAGKLGLQGSQSIYPEVGRAAREEGSEQTSRTTRFDSTLLIPDIRDFDGRRFRGATLLTGGFPCQPVSCAGKRRGKEDDRWLWPEMRRVIAEARPTWILGENVAGVVHLGLEQVYIDLEAEGYEVQTLIIPACAVNAPHRRDRVWIIGYAHRHGQRGLLRETGQGEDRTELREDIDRENPGAFRLRASCDAPNPIGGGGDRRAKEPRREQETGTIISRPSRHDPDPPSCGRRAEGRRLRQSRPPGERRGRPDDGHTPWLEPWLEIATRLCRVDDGISHRVHRLKALGNAIVPQVAHEIIKRIAAAERGSPAPEEK